VYVYVKINTIDLVQNLATILFRILNFGNSKARLITFYHVSLLTLKSGKVEFTSG